MPPVFGPVSPSPMRLKSWAATSGTTLVPSVRQNNDTSGPSRYSSMTTRSHAAALDEFGAPYVVKNDGLAAGKGVLVTSDRAAALAHAAACERCRAVGR